MLSSRDTQQRTLSRCFLVHCIAIRYVALKTSHFRLYFRHHLRRVSAFEMNNPQYGNNFYRIMECYSDYPILHLSCHALKSRHID